MKALILAAGYAIRLYPLTTNAPKPLIEIARRKIIDRILDHIANIKKVDSIYIITNDKFFEKFSDWLNGSRYRNRISLINDGSTSNETRLGAIKDLEIAIVEKDIDDNLLVVAGDNLFEFDLDEFLKYASDRPDGISVALYDIKDYASARRFGVVKVDRDNRIVDFEEKPEGPKSTLISTGIYYFPKKKLPFIKEYLDTSGKGDDAPGYCISWLAKVDVVHGFIFSEDWYDIGDIESLKKADSEYLKKENKRYDKA